MAILKHILLFLIVFSITFFAVVHYCIPAVKTYTEQYVQRYERMQQLIEKGLKLEELEKEHRRRRVNYAIWSEEYKDFLKRMYDMQYPDLHHEA